MTAIELRSEYVHNLTARAAAAAGLLCLLWRASRPSRPIVAEDSGGSADGGSSAAPLRIFGGTTPTWKVGPGPFGRGDCLSERQADGVTLILAPPGVPLAPPEPVNDLVCWRFARWAAGRMVASPQTLTLSEALRVVPSQRSWIVARAREHHERNLETGLIPALEEDEAWLSDSSTRADRRLLYQEADRLPLYSAFWELPGVAASSCAHRFAHFVRSCADDAPIKKIARETNNRSAAWPEFRDQVALLAQRDGADAVREAVVALLYARSRSRSWRLTQVCDLASREQGLARQLSEQIDQAPSPENLERALVDLASRCPNLSEEVIAILYDRSHSLRWRSSEWLRLLAASPHLEGVRTVLREHVPASWRLDDPTCVVDADDTGLARDAPDMVIRA